MSINKRLVQAVGVICLTMRVVGYDIGVRALKAIVKLYDGRGSETILTTKVLKHCGVVNVPELVHCVYSQEHPRTYTVS